jgi:lipopolysaccharide/colanic/teichoic acid biosynthesis glycosyltransferase
VQVAGYPLVLPQEQFEAEIARETERSNRRNESREFALITFDYSDRQADDRKIMQLAQDLTRRLRISDTIGWFNLHLAVLLPETSHDGAIGVANDLARIASHHGINVETTVSIYPWDDSLTKVAEELRKEVSSLEGRDNDDNDLHGGGGFGNSARVRKDHSHADSGPHISSQGSEDPFGDENNGNLMASLELSDGGTAIAVAPVVAKAKPKSHGTGHSIMFRSEKTPVWKRTIDIVGSGVGILFLSPLFVGAAIAIKVSAPGPVFFRQMREGKDGKPFGILKFRTMVIDAEAKQDELRDQSEQDGPAFKLKDDPRVTRVGRYLRKSCIDELPQLFNVLFGQMSLVGPRPLPVGESEQCNAWQRQRLSVLPGCTCIWQARGGRDIKFSQWMRMDLEYIQKRSFFYDMRLILETVYIAVLHKGSV